ncbi:signal peptidase I [Pseudomonas sp. 13B_2.1_Bac1]|uniref:Signal peptidase I n=1 Tax=Pseudomonas aylmerensis TaxID=1869229 RepID=A0A2T4G7R8_9PSED|nr:MULTISPECIES: signal peptidase I [Pseudomonas]AYF49567.1 signal peptidase I [Pseudomonas fluorescens]MBK5478000.1 signal peptidase I [Pseudomonas sp. TH21]MCU1786128.1 signal peptidase I [Pseudomonas sp. 13B_2.1_Bac1]OCW29436.1 signal peptidase I [Pseudomonas aylmerensis]PTC31730.1 signal peptidase I [Pseudomonas aylmerensis]
MRSWLIRYRYAIIFWICFGVFRTSLADWNPIPSGSMRPTLLEGDVVLVNRVAYDLKVPLTDISLAHLDNPQRGDVVTFSSPKDGMRLIKRIVGVPGDTLEMRDEVLWVNGTPATYSDAQDISEPIVPGHTVPGIKLNELAANRQRTVQFMPTVRAMRNFAPVVVPADSYFMLGDNRDNSDDSRYIGFVPRRLLIGRAHHVLASAQILDDWMPRFRRFGASIL